VVIPWLGFIPILLFVVFGEKQPFRHGRRRGALTGYATEWADIAKSEVFKPDRPEPIGKSVLSCRFPYRLVHGRNAGMQRTARCPHGGDKKPRLAANQ